MSEFTKFNNARLNDRQVTELIGIARGLIADGYLADAEILYLRKWLAASETINQNPLLGKLSERIEQVLSDDIIDDDERAEIFEALHGLTGDEFELGEVLKPTTLPLCSPAPNVSFDGNRFTFTGAFVFGKRKDCEKAMSDRGGSAGSLRKDTSFLVIGEYASDDWIHSTYGRKIERAVELRDAGTPIRIISEQHWRSFL